MAAALAVLDIAIRGYRFLMPYDPAASFSLRALWVLGLTVAGAATYGTVTFLMRFSEWSWIRQAISKDARA